MEVGALYRKEGVCEFVVWAPFAREAALRIVAPGERFVAMERVEGGYWRVVAEGVWPGTLYLYRLGSVERPDPASMSQPRGVHAPSAVVDHSFPWEDGGFKAAALEDMVLYEVHTGVFTPEGTFEAITKRLPELVDLGVNAISLMPVAQFPGERNWGYDGAYPYAPQDSYGGPGGLKTLVNACHKKGLSVVLDVVYNHLGPEGNYLADFGAYFTEKYRTLWGGAVNLDDAWSDQVRDFFIENALHWFKYYHMDGLRIDAVHAIFDMSARHFLAELSERVEEFSREKGRKFYLIPESDLNDVRVITPRESRGAGGYGCDAQWSDDFHHCLHTLLTGERRGYYEDFGEVRHLVKAIKEGYVYSGQYSSYRKRRHGSFSGDIAASRFVVFSQNHDQVGNRPLGDRLPSLVPFEAVKLAAGMVILSPFIPLIFMGEEYGETSPFLYFTSHEDPGLAENVRKGRVEEFRAFDWKETPPDPQDVETFLSSKLGWEKRGEGRHHLLLNFYRKLLKLRKETPALARPDNKDLEVLGLEEEKTVIVRRWKAASSVLCIFNFNKNDVELSVSLAQERWTRLLDSSGSEWEGPGTLLPETLREGERVQLRALSFAVYSKAK